MVVPECGVGQHVGFRWWALFQVGLVLELGTKREGRVCLDATQQVFTFFVWKSGVYFVEGRAWSLVRGSVEFARVRPQHGGQCRVWIGDFPAQGNWGSWKDPGGWCVVWHYVRKEGPSNVGSGRFIFAGFWCIVCAWRPMWLDLISHNFSQFLN